MRAVIHRACGSWWAQTAAACTLSVMHEWWVPLLESDGLLLRDRALTAADPEADILGVVERWRGGAGCVQVRERLAEADGVAESILETAGRLALRDRAVPLPIPQYVLSAPDGTIVARLDGAYLDEKVALEFDGADPHGLPEAVFRDRWRQNRLPEIGWTVLRFTWWDVTRDPDGVAALVQRTLRRRAA